MKNLKSTSKFLSLILRHQPEVIGVMLDDEGWLEVDLLISQANANGKQLSRALIEEVVANCEKQRFSLSEDGRLIRANQGHSIRQVDLALEPVTPPELLYHGTVAKFVQSIQLEGLKKRARNHVHLSLDLPTATQVGQRRGKPVLLAIRALEMHQAGYPFYLSKNGVWLTDQVPPEFIDF